MGRLCHGKDLIVEDFIPPVSAANNFSEYIINPRWPTRFPSASLTAQRYDMYCFEELEFHYFPTTAVTTSQGIVFMGWEPNANRGPPETVAQMNAFEHHTQGPIYSSGIRLRVPKSALGGLRYCRNHATCSDLNFYDTGRLILGGDKNSGALGGYVEVYYKVRFFQYHLEETLPYQSRCAMMDASGTTTTTALADGVWTTIDNTLSECFSPQGCITKVATGQWLVPAGKYMVNALCNWGGLSGGQLQAVGLRIVDLAGTVLNNLYSRKYEASGTGFLGLENSDNLSGLLTLNEPTTIQMQAYTDINGAGNTAVASNYSLNLLALE